MTKEEFLAKKKAITDELVSKKNTIECEAYRKQVQLEKEYAATHNIVEIGDIVSDYYSTIIVEEFTLVRGNNRDPLPSLLYTGAKLTKKGVPFKNGEKGTVYSKKMQRVVKKEQK